MNIGFIGLGTMGSVMAARLIEAGHDVRVWNRSPEPVAALVAAGATAASSPGSLCEGIDVLVSILADDDAIKSVMTIPGVIEALRPGAIHINMATISVDCARELARLHEDHGIHYVAAPVLGRVDVAAAGQLNILVAGDAKAIRSIEPVLDILGRKTWFIGERPEQANVVKLSVNTMIAGAIEAMAESIALSQGYGVEREVFVDLVTSTGFSAPIYKVYGDAIAQRRFEPAGFKLSLGLKDIRLTLEAAEHAHVPMPLASLLRDAHVDSLAHGEGELDWAALSLVALRRAAQE